MNLVEMKAIHAKDLQLATWCIPLRGEDEILLAYKKRGFGKDLWNASGGKVKPEEKVDEAARREAGEELDIVVENLLLVATMEFYFQSGPIIGMRVEGFTTRTWTGEPKETEEMIPKWFKYKEIPYKQMWPDDEIWLPRVLAGEKLEGEFLFGEGNKILEYNLRPLQTIQTPR